MSHVERADGGTPNGVMIASKLPFEAVSATPPGVTSGGVLVLATFEGSALLACYFPQEEFKARIFSACAEAAEGWANTAIQSADETPTGTKFACDLLAANELAPADVTANENTPAQDAEAGGGGEKQANCSSRPSSPIQSFSPMRRLCRCSIRVEARPSDVNLGRSR